VALYEWHAALSVASFGLLHHFEVLVRNAIDHALGAGQPQTPIKDTWLLDFETLQPDRHQAGHHRDRAAREGKLVTRGRIVAGLSFGFWAGLFGRRLGLVPQVPNTPTAAGALVPSRRVSFTSATMRVWRISVSTS